MSNLSVVTQNGKLDRVIEYSVDNKRGLGYVANKRAPWGKLVRVLTAENRTDMTQKQYKALSEDQKSLEKMRAGFIVGGHCNDNKRIAANVPFRSFLNLDIDNLTPESYQQFKDEVGLASSGIYAYEFVWHTTRSHTPETPKVRIIVPLIKPVSADRFVAASRVLASKFDPTMEHVDPVSFRIAQFMYKPMTNADGEFESGHNEAMFLNADQMLDEFGDWQDFSKLPCRESESLSNLVAPGTKQENPFEKKGIVGAFNRAYPIEEAIDEFLSDVYERSAEVSSNGVRYTYLKSSTGQSNGVLVYPDQGLMYSHHTSDPAGGGHSYNAFDMVRLHRFGHADLDSKVKPDTSPTKLPSYKLMVEQFDRDEEVSKQMLAERYDLDALVAASMADLAENDEEDDTPETPAGEDMIGNDADDLDVEVWQTKLDRGEGGSLLPTLRNVVEILTKDKRVAGMVALDEFSGGIVKLRRFPAGTLGTLAGGKKVRERNVSDVKKGDAWSDRDDAKMRYFLQLPSGNPHNGYQLRAAKQDVIDAIDLAADINRFHPVKKAFESVKWDGRSRVSTLFMDYLGCPDDEYHRKTAELVMIAMIARVYTPGHKWDYVPILEGKQGKRKSAFIHALSMGWFAEMRGDVVTDSKKTAELLEGVLVVEIPELHTFNRSESSALKAFFSAYNDKARAAFARRTSINKRQAVFWGTTNDKEYLRDKSGNRRYWPILCLIEFIDIDRLESELPQIYAEALMLYKALLIDYPSGRIPLYLEEGSEAALTAEELQESRRIESAADREKGPLELWLDEPMHPSMVDCQKITDDFTDDEELVQRSFTCSKEVLEVLAKGDDRKGEVFRRLMGELSGWRFTKAAHHTQRYGPAKLFVRIGSEADRRYR